MIPDFQSIMLPLLQTISDGKEYSIRNVKDELAQKFGLTDQEKQQLLPSGRQTTFDNRVAWAKSYMLQAGLLVSERRGYFKISERGGEALSKNPSRIDIRYLEQYPEFIEFRNPERNGSDRQGTVPSLNRENETPEEEIEKAHDRLIKDLSAALLEQIRKGSDRFFEELVVDLMIALGYGGSREEAGRAIGRSGDEGLDGVISQDRLGIDNIYLQAKKWKDTVERPEVQKFVGALQGKQAKKGVFITTSTFSSGSRDYVSHIEPRVILIDGFQLTKLMMECNVGLTPIARYEVKKIDLDYFDED